MAQSHPGLRCSKRWQMKKNTEFVLQLVREDQHSRKIIYANFLVEQPVSDLLQ